MKPMFECFLMAVIEYNSTIYTEKILTHCTSTEHLSSTDYGYHFGIWWTRLLVSERWELQYIHQNNNKKLKKSKFCWHWWLHYFYKQLAHIRRINILLHISSVTKEALHRWRECMHCWGWRTLPTLNITVCLVFVTSVPVFRGGTYFKE